MKLISGGVILVNIKRIFLDAGMDYEYAIVQSYRMVRGDHMVAQMWEPHQTSAFLNAIFIKIFMVLTGATTGMAVYLNIVGVGVKLGVAYLFYRTFRKYCDKNILLLMCAFFMTVNAKGFIVLDFSNLIDYSSILLCCCLFTYFQRQQSGYEKKIFVILAAVCFWMEVFSYPSAVILFPFILAVLYRYSETGGKDIALFSGVCFVFGVLFFGGLILQTGWERFWISARYIMMGDNTHQAGRLTGQLKIYLADVGSMAVLFFVGALLAFFIGKLLAHKGMLLSKADYIAIFFVVLFIYIFFQTLIDVTDDGFSITFRSIYTAVYILLLALAYMLKEYCGKEEQMVFHLGAGISVISCAAVLLLTNWPMLVTMTHLGLGVMVSMIPIGGYLKTVVPEKKGSRLFGVLILFLLLTVFRNIYVFSPSGMQYATILSVRQVIKGGPMKGMLSNYMGGFVQNSNLKDWEQYVQAGDRILIVGDNAVYSTIGYLYEDTEICVDSTISTPTYSEKLLSYWELNPWKEPNVVILECWYGEPRVPVDAWIMGWIRDNFDSYAEGNYVRIYRRDG